MKIFTNIFVSLFYVGYVKLLPGTFGSLVSLIILFPICEFEIISKQLFITFFIVIFILSLYFIKKFHSYTNTHDSSKIVIDEFLGIYLVLIFYDLIFIINSQVTIILIFILFRFFDIIKIFPANIIDKNMRNSFGVILDDIIASIYTIIGLYLINAYN
tara:strand:- start:36 stop:509 length:474 start_codon:yes stop_codon:yes gene_type:complete